MNGMQMIDIADIHPAPYNPRKITDEAYHELQGSLRTLGFILPIIVNADNMRIVAGHQRTKAATAVGIRKVPVFYVHDVQLADEIRFNQVHNGIESEPKELGAYHGGLEPGRFYTDVPNADFTETEIQATLTKNMCQLITQFGDALCAIVCDGKVCFGNNYVRACQLLGIPVHAYILEPSKAALYNYYFSQDYGVYCYEHIDRADYVQGMAQMTNKMLKNSQIYKVALPFLLAEDRRDVSVLDFGCGKAFSINELHMKMGFHKAIGLEFFNHNRKGISIEKGQRMIDRVIEHVQRYGKFDYVICDSVLNSVNCMEAHDGVLNTLMLFCRKGGKIFFSGRNAEPLREIYTAKRDTRTNTYSQYFPDQDGFTSVMREGQWFFQKFHTKEQVQAIIDRLGLDVIASRRDSGCWQVGGIKTRELTDEEYMSAIDFEFNMRLPNNQRYGRHNDIRELFGFPRLDTPFEIVEDFV